MSIIRQDPTTKEWVILAPERVRRPHDRREVQSGTMLPVYEPTCPFCPAHEDRTPPEVMRTPDSSSGFWTVRVIPNKFAALHETVQPERRESFDLFREMDGVGNHEVIIDTPDHNGSLSQMDVAHVETLLQVYQARYRDFRAKPWLRTIIIFKNHGLKAGTSIEHPHTQIVGTPVTPMNLRRKYEVAIGHFDDTGRCLYGDIVDAERKAGRRIILESSHFVVFHPYASHVPFETWVAPKRHHSSFGRTEPEELSDLAHVLRKTLEGIGVALDNPDYNMIVHSAPIEDENKRYYLWHIQVLPRLGPLAGFELGSGIFISTMMPEDSAATMRRVLERIDGKNRLFGGRNPEHGSGGP